MLAKCIVGYAKEVQMFLKNHFLKYIFFFYPSSFLWSQSSEAYNPYASLLPITFVYLKLPPIIFKSVEQYL